MSPPRPPLCQAKNGAGTLEAKIRQLEKELAEAGKASEALYAAMAKLQEELVKVTAERDAGKEAVKALEAKLSTVRQKEIQDAKEAQLEDAKKIRELKEENQKLVGLKDQLQRLRQDNDNAKQEVVQMTVSRAYLSTYISTLRKKHRLSFNSAHHVVCDLARS